MYWYLDYSGYILILGKVILVIYPSIDKIINKVGSKYLLVHVASKRAREIDESKYLQMKEEKYKCKKSIGRALEEVMEDLIHIK